MAQFDAKTVHKNDWGVIGGGVVVLIASFLTWFSIDIAIPGFKSPSANGWDSGSLALLGILCAIAAAGLVAARVYGVDLPKLGVGWRTIILGLSALGTLFILFRMLSGYSGLDRGIGLFLALIGSIAQTVFAYLAFADSGERADIDRMRAERAAKSAAASPPPPPAAPVASDAPHDHTGHDHPHA